MKKEVKEKEKKGNKSKKKTKNNINKLDNIKIYIKKVLNYQNNYQKLIY